MKFLLDVCASSGALRTLLTKPGHDVISALEHDPRAWDEVLLALAMECPQIMSADLDDLTCKI
jgi:hypothetical protein